MPQELARRSYVIRGVPDWAVIVDRLGALVAVGQLILFENVRLTLAVGVPLNATPMLPVTVLPLLIFGRSQAQ